MTKEVKKSLWTLSQIWKSLTVVLPDGSSFQNGPPKYLNDCKPLRVWFSSQCLKDLTGSLNLFQVFQLPLLQIAWGDVKIKRAFEGLTTWIVDSMTLLGSFNVSLSEKCPYFQSYVSYHSTEIPLLYHLIICNKILFQFARKSLVMCFCKTQRVQTWGICKNTGNKILYKSLEAWGLASVVRIHWNWSR